MDGFWLELSTDARGILTGAARSAWPAVVTTGPVANHDTPATYGVKVSNFLTALCAKTFGVIATQVVRITIRFASLSPLALDPNDGVVIDEADCKAFRVR